MHFPPRQFSLALLGVSLAWLPAGDVGAACPQGCLSCGTCTNAIYDECTVPAHDLVPAYGASRDLAKARMTGFGADGYGTTASVADTFVVLGLPPGTPIQITATVVVQASGHGQIGCEVDFVGSALPFPGNVGFNRTLAPDLSGACPPETYAVTNQVMSGAPFYLKHTLRLSPAIPGDASAVSQLTFAGLPAGTIVTSCNGYGQDGPTAVATSTWGSLKLRYH